jgi:uncharacterized damage-inducible protein DinB
MLRTQFTFDHYVIKKNVEGLTHEDSLKQPQPGGNCLNWVLGHIVATRRGVLELLGKENALPGEELDRYKRHSAPVVDPQDALPIEEILDALDRSQEAVLSGLEELEQETLNRPVPKSPFGRDDETVGSLLAGLAFHEAYHVGQTGILRRLAGYPGAIQ